MTAKMKAIRVLLIEDNPNDVLQFRLYLKESGEIKVRFSQAESLAKAKEILKNEVIDVIITDLNLPDSQGLDILKSLRSVASHIPIVVLTERGDQDLGMEAVKLGAHDLLVKGKVPGQALVRVLRYAIERHNVFKKLQKSEARFKYLIEKNPDGVIIVDGEEGEILYANPAAKDLFGSPLEKLKGTNVGIPVVKDKTSVVEILSLRGKQSVVEMFPAEIEWEEKKACLISFHDITERYNLAEKLKENERRYRSLVENVPIGLFSTTPEGRFLDANPALAAILGVSDVTTLLQKNAQEFYLSPQDREEWRKILDAKGELKNYEIPGRRVDGKVVWIRKHTQAIKDDQGRIIRYEGAIREITEERRIRQELETELQIKNAFADISASFLAPETDVNLIAQLVLRHAKDLTHSPHGYVGQVEPETGDLIGLALTNMMEKDGQGKEEAGPVRFPKQADGYPGLWGHSLNTKKAHFTNDPSRHQAFKNPPGHIPIRRFMAVPALVGDKIVGQVAVANAEEDYTKRDLEVLERLAEFLAIALDKKSAEKKIGAQLASLRALYEGARLLSQSLDPERIAQESVELAVEKFGVKLAWLGLARPDGQMEVVSFYPREISYPQEIKVRWDDTEKGQGPTGRAFRQKKPVVAETLEIESSFKPWRKKALSSGFRSSAAFPLISRREALGTLNVYSDSSRFFTQEGLASLQAFAHLASASLENARLFQEASQRLRQLQALRNVDLAITSSLDPNLTLKILLDEVITNLEIWAASVFLLNPTTLALEFAAGHGFRTKQVEKLRFVMGRGLVGQAVWDRKSIWISSLEELDQAEPELKKLIQEEGFKIFSVHTLVSKNRVLGILTTFHQKEFKPTDEFQRFINALTGQAAIAIENAQLFQDLEKSNMELRLAYDATIEGWSRAMDIRDKETEGHTQRVTEMTVDIAREMGMSEEELVYVRWGALLHDMGKLGVPDNILLKPGKLTPEEWKVMKQHPKLAYEMFFHIKYLRPALSIPYCHHEKWDGTGYPRGIKGEQIPLEARIFAVVDVYDALTSDRPYRKAWSKRKALSYLKEQAGKSFDPKVVEVFMSKYGRKRGELPKEKDEEKKGLPPSRKRLI